MKGDKQRFHNFFFFLMTHHQWPKSWVEADLHSFQVVFISSKSFRLENFLHIEYYHVLVMHPSNFYNLSKIIFPIILLSSGQSFQIPFVTMRTGC